MEKILSYLMINLYFESFPHLSKIQSVTETYLQSVHSAALISNDLPHWKDAQFSFPLEIRNLENITELTQSGEAFIMDLRGYRWSQKYLQPLKRSADSKFVIITAEKNVKLLSDSLIRLGLCHAMVLNILKDDVEVTELKDPCRGIKGKPEKSLSCKANVSFFDYPPDIVFDGSRLSGTEGAMAQTALDHLGFKLFYVNRHETFFGEYDPPSGLYGDMITGSSLAGLGVLYPLYERWDHMDMIFGCGYTQLSWAVPAGAAPRQSTWSVILVSELSLTVWICLAVAYLALIPVAIIINWKSRKYSTWPFHIFALILGVPQKLLLSRSLALAIVFFGLLVSAHYQAMMGSKLTAPAKIPEISTLEELADSGLHLKGPPIVGIFLNLSSAAHPDIVALFKISSRYEPTLQELNELLPRIIDRRDSAYLRHRTFVHNYVEKVSFLLANFLNNLSSIFLWSH